MPILYTLNQRKDKGNAPTLLPLKQVKQGASPGMDIPGGTGITTQLF